jgi:tripartite-type tricarboxylate transporter receptor subunit TctC
VRSPPDGHTLLLVNPTNAINATLYDKLNFNFIRDIAPVASIMRVPFVMEVNPSRTNSIYSSSGGRALPTVNGDWFMRPTTTW